MIGENLSAFYLKKNGIILKDDYEEPIPSLTFPKLSGKSFDIEYVPFYIQYDVLAKRSKIKPRKIAILKFYSDLEKKGFVIVSTKAKEKWFARHQVTYVIKKRENLNKDDKILGGIPAEHRIELDEANNQLRLVGANAGIGGYGNWITIKPLENVQGGVMSSEQMMAKYLGEVFLNPRNRFKIKFPTETDIPFMVNVENKLVCIPQRADAITIGITGKRGSGKSLIAHSIIDNIFWRWKARVWIANDNMQETLEWLKPNTDFLAQLNALNMKPIGLPIVMVLPYSNTLVLQRFKKDTPLVIMSLPFIQMIEKLSLGGSAIYLQNIINDYKEFEECESEEEVLNLIENRMQEIVDNSIDKRKEQSFMNMKIKIMNYIKNLFARKLCDINCINERTEFGNITKTIRVGEEIEYVFPALMRAGVVPSLNTFDLLTFDKKDYHYHYLEAIYQGIYDWQNNLPEEERKQVYGFIDELQKIASTQKARNPAGDALANMVMSGRPIQMGLIYATPNYTKIPTDIVKGTTYLIALRQKSKEECEAIEKDFSLEKHHIEKMLSFQRFEAIALTTEDEGFALYDELGNRTLTNEPQVGRIIPPLSLHKKPA